MSKSHLKKNYCIQLITGIFIISVMIFTIPFLLSKEYTVITVEAHICKIDAPTFTLSWIHSVDKTPWLENYKRAEQGFILTQSIFKTFGAGVPHDGKVLQSDDGMIHYEMNQFIKEINWVVDKEVQSTILLPNHSSWEIYKNTERYSEVQIRNQLLNFWQRLLIRNCHES